MSRNAFIGHTLKYRKPRSKPDCMTTPHVRYDHAGQMNVTLLPHKGVDGCPPGLLTALRFHQSCLKDISAGGIAKGRISLFWCAKGGRGYLLA